MGEILRATLQICRDISCHGMPRPSPPHAWRRAVHGTIAASSALSAMIEFQHVFKSYGRGRNILADINFRITAGEFVFVSGPSGAGKSTLLKLIGGLEPPAAAPSR